MVAVDFIHFNLRKAGARADDARSLVLMDFVVADVYAAIVHDYAVLVVVDFIEFYPAEATFYAEDALRSGLVDFVGEYHCVG